MPMTASIDEEGYIVTAKEGRLCGVPVGIVLWRIKNGIFLWRRI